MAAAKVAHLLFENPRDPLNQTISEFIISRQAGGCSPRTTQYYHDELGWLRDYLFGQKIHDVADITATHLRGFLLHMAERRNSGGVHCAYRVCKTFLRWYEVEYQLEGWMNPITRVKPPKLKHEPLEPLDLVDLKAMLATCGGKGFTDVRDRAILLCLLDTGCRASEFISLDVEDINLTTGAVRIRNGKGGKWRVTFLGTKARRELARYWRRIDTKLQGPLWMTDDGHRLTVSGLRCIVQRRAKRANIQCPSLHSFRRAFALMSLRAGMDVYSLQKLMGHSDLSVLRRYLAQTEDDLAEAHKKAGPVDRLL